MFVCAICGYRASLPGPCPRDKAPMLAEPRNLPAYSTIEDPQEDTLEEPNQLPAELLAPNQPPATLPSSNQVPAALLEEDVYSASDLYPAVGSHLAPADVMLHRDAPTNPQYQEALRRAAATPPRGIYARLPVEEGFFSATDLVAVPSNLLEDELAPSAEDAEAEASAQPVKPPKLLPLLEETKSSISDLFMKIVREGPEPQPAKPGRPKPAQAAAWKLPKSLTPPPTPPAAPVAPPQKPQTAPPRPKTVLPPTPTPAPVLSPKEPTLPPVSPAPSLPGPPTEPPAPSHPWIGVVLFEYKIVRCIGVGGIGSVYHAIHERTQQHVAMKIIHARHSKNPDVLHRLFDEARAANQLQHPNIVRIIDVGTLDGGRVGLIIMELLHGQDLDSYLKTTKVLTLGEFRHIATQIGEALAAAHAAGIVHRALKPDAIFLHQEGEAPVVKLLDFGIAKLAAQAGVLLGTPAYMPPEQALGRPVDERSDLYALGIIFYRCITGVLPFRAQDTTALLMQQVSEPAPPMKRPGSRIPARLEELVMSCLEKEPTQRPASMAAIVRELHSPSLFS